MNKKIANTTGALALIGLAIILFDIYSLLLGTAKDLPSEIRTPYAFSTLMFGFLFFIPSMIYFSSIMEINLSMGCLCSLIAVSSYDFFSRNMNIEINIILLLIFSFIPMLISAIIFFLNETTKSKKIKKILNTKMWRLLQADKKQNEF